MKRTDVFLKVTIDVKTGEDPHKLAEELARKLRESYGVRFVEVSNLIDRD